MTLGRQIAERRKSLRLTQQALGQSAGGLSQSAVAWIETGKHRPTTDTLAKLAKVLGCRFVVDARGVRLSD